MALIPPRETVDVDLVYDLDWTLINLTTEAMVKAFPENTLQIDNLWYRWSAGAVEILAQQHLRGLRISFFSGGSPERNQQAIHQLTQKINTYLDQKYPGSPRFQAYLVLNKNNLSLVSNDPNLKFADRYKKDLSLYFDLKKAILIDDIQKFAVPGQEKNMLWLGKTYNDRPVFERQDLENPQDIDYSAPNKSEWQRDINKLYASAAIINQALAIQKQQPLLNFVQAVDLSKTRLTPSAGGVTCQSLLAVPLAM